MARCKDCNCCLLDNPGKFYKEYLCFLCKKCKQLRDNKKEKEKLILA